MKERSSIENKLSTVKYRCDKESHLRAKQEECLKCHEKSCTFVCPANVWKLDEFNRCIIEYENCLECGACRISCPRGAIDWNYPKGGKGIIYKQS